MLQKIVLKCTCKGEQRPSYNWGSLMHGVLMELLPEKAADLLHEANLRPFSQYVLPMSENKFEWHIGTWDNDVSNDMAKAISVLSHINLKHKGMILEVSNVTRSIQSERDFFARFFTTEYPCRRYKLEFLTPCTHKSEGEYVLYPTPKLILQSLHARFCAFSQEFSLDDEEMLAQLVAHTRIVHYSLRSAQYYLESVRVNGYRGRVTLSVSGSEQIARLVGMLLSFAEYSGIGIKTSLGMGGCRTEQLSSSSKPAYNIKTNDQTEE